MFQTKSHTFQNWKWLQLVCSLYLIEVKWESWFDSSPTNEFIFSNKNSTNTANELILELWIYNEIISSENFS